MFEMNPGEPPGAGVGHPATGGQPAPKRAGAAAICKNEGNRASSHLREIRFMKGILANPKTAWLPEIVPGESSRPHLPWCKRKSTREGFV